MLSYIPVKLYQNRPKKAPLFQQTFCITLPKQGFKCYLIEMSIKLPMQLRIFTFEKGLSTSLEIRLHGPPV